MKNFADAAFEPEVIDVMTAALNHAVASLPEPVSSAHVERLAESIVRTANFGERSAAVLDAGLIRPAARGLRNRSLHAGVLPA
jgi:hypothetical protein